MIQYIRIIDFDENQTFKRLNPSWIKFHNHIFDELRFLKLEDHSRFHLLGLMLLASRIGNKIPADHVYLKYNLKATKKVDLAPLIEQNFIEIIGEEMEVEKKVVKKLSSQPSLEQVKEVFEYWKTTLSHKSAKMDKKRVEKIRSALTLGYPLPILKNAIEGCLHSKYHMGENPDGKKYDSLGLILRDADHIDRFLSYYETYQKSQRPKADFWKSPDVPRRTSPPPKEFQEMRKKLKKLQK